MSPNPLKPELLRILHGLPEEAWANNLWRQALYRELGAGRCTEVEVSSFESESLSVIRRAVRGVFGDIPSLLDEKGPTKRTRGVRAKQVRHPRIVGIRYVRRHSLDPFVNSLVSAGARATLLYLIARCGKGRVFKKQTCLVATDLGIAQRTVQAHYAALDKAGYIIRGAVDPKTGATPIRLTEAVEPPSFKPAAEPTPPSSASETQESAPTKPIKEEYKTTYVEGVDTGGVGSEARSAAVPLPHEPGPGLSRPAQGRARALESEEMLDWAFRQDREMRRDSSQNENAGLTEFNRHLNAILVGIACKQAEREENREHLARSNYDSGSSKSCGDRQETVSDSSYNCDVAVDRRIINQENRRKSPDETSHIHDHRSVANKREQGSPRERGTRLSSQDSSSGWRNRPRGMRRANTSMTTRT